MRSPARVISIPLLQLRSVKRFSLGSIEIAIINTGDLLFSLKDVENVPEKEWGKYAPYFQKPELFPTQSVLISTSTGQNILVDPGNYERLRSYDDEFAAMVPPNYRPPQTLEDQLSGLGKTPEDIDYVVITHAHYDHYSGATRKNSPAFPKARYLLGRADWEDERIASAVKRKGSPEHQSLGLIREMGKLELLSETRSLGEEIEIIPSPGESLGHQVVHAHSKGKSLYCVGDLFHSPVEVENFTWMPPWSDVKTCVRSRRELVEAALIDNSLIYASHMPLGRVFSSSATSSGVKFAPES